MNNNGANPFVATSNKQKGKVVTKEQAVKLIKNADVVATSGFVGIGFAEELAIALEQRFIATGQPRDLTLVYAAGQGDGKTKGLNHLGQEGLVKRVVGGHWGLAPELQKLAIADKIEAYNFPQGVISHMFRDIASHRPRTITHVGLGSFADPRLGGGKINPKTNEDLVELIQFDGKDYLAYRTFPINIAFLRGTTADIDGNVTMEKEALTTEALAIASAVRNSGGFVIVQVERIADRNTLNARQVKIPGIMVDCVVKTEDMENHWQTFGVKYDPAFSCEIRKPLSSIEPMPLNERKIIARRSALELAPNAIVNLGIGMPEGIASVAAEGQILDSLTLTAEPGVIGGIPAGGLSFGAATNTEAVVDQPYQFDFYDGGGLDVCFLGLAQADMQGNLNVSKFGPKLAGCGGFINISQNAKKVVFTGTFTAGGLKTSVSSGRLSILQEGRAKKFVKQVEHVTFSGQVALQAKQPVYYVTERCVFHLTEKGMELIEVAPGIDVEKDIIAHMEFEPIISGQPALMDECIFLENVLDLRSKGATLSLEERFSYMEEDNQFLVNFERLSITDSTQIEGIRDLIERHCRPLGKKVHTILNGDGFTVVPELIRDYEDMIGQIMERYFEDACRYSAHVFSVMQSRHIQ